MTDKPIDLEVEVADKLAEYFKDPIDDPCCYCEASKAVIPIIRKAVEDEIYGKTRPSDLTLLSGEGG